MSLLSIPLSAQEFIGDWKGSLEIQGNELPIVFHITEVDGQLTASMDSPDQGAFGISTDTCYLEDEQLIIKASKYAQIEETVNPAVLEYVTNWILSLK